MKAVICDFMGIGEWKKIIVTSQRWKQMSMPSQRGLHADVWDFTELGLKAESVIVQRYGMEANV